MSVFDQCSLVSFLAQQTACNDKHKTRRKESVSSILPRTKIGYSKEGNDQRDQKRTHFIGGAKTNFLLLFPARFAHAHYKSRMIVRFPSWGDHGKPHVNRSFALALAKSIYLERVKRQVRLQPNCSIFNTVRNYLDLRIFRYSNCVCIGLLAHFSSLKLALG